MNAIVAVDQNWAIGKEGDQLVYLKEDLKHCCTLTTGHTIVVGRKTLSTFPGGKPLKGRDNWILSRAADFFVEGARVFGSVEALLKEVPQDAFVVGGASVYQALLGSKSVLAAVQTDAAAQAGGAGQTGAAAQADDAGQTGAAAQTDGAAQAIVRPWLQDFTASYLDTYIEYGDDQVRQQIQAVYDAGYDEWILWDAGVSYHYGGLLTPENAAIEEEQIRSEREAALRALPEAGAAPVQQEAETAPAQQGA